MKKILIFTGLSAVFFIGSFIFLLRRPAEGSVYTIKQENLVDNVLVNGTYTTASQTQVPSPTNGVITELFVSNKESVKKGDALFHVESTATDDQKKTAYANYLAANATLQSDNAALYGLQSTMFSKWKTYLDLATSDTYQNSDKTPKNDSRAAAPFNVAYDDWLDAQADYKNQQNVIAKDQAALTAAKQLYDQTQSVTVVAPLDGSVVNLMAKVGDQVVAATSPVLLVTDFSNPVIKAAVNEVNIPKIKTGQVVKITFDSLPGKSFSGAVGDIDQVGTKFQGATTYNVAVIPADLTAEVLPNMTASLTIETGRRENTPVVLNEALIKKDGKTFVQKVGSSKDNLTEVTLGLEGLIKTEITKGLSIGDQVIIPE